MPHIPQSLSQLLKGVEAEANAANPPEFVKALKWSIPRAVGHDFFRNVRAKVDPVRKHFCTFTIDKAQGRLSNLFGLGGLFVADFGFSVGSDHIDELFNLFGFGFSVGSDHIATRW